MGGVRLSCVRDSGLTISALAPVACRTRKVTISQLIEPIVNLEQSLLDGLPGITKLAMLALRMFPRASRRRVNEEHNPRHVYVPRQFNIPSIRLAELLPADVLALPLMFRPPARRSDKSRRLSRQLVRCTSVPIRGVAPVLRGAEGGQAASCRGRNNQQHCCVHAVPRPPIR